MPAKLVILYPYPSDVERFERDYVEDHMPMVFAETMPAIQKSAVPTVGSRPYRR